MINDQNGGTPKEHHEQLPDPRRQKKRSLRRDGLFLETSRAPGSPDDQRQTVLGELRPDHRLRVRLVCLPSQGGPAPEPRPARSPRPRSRTSGLATPETRLGNRQTAGGTRPRDATADYDDGIGLSRNEWRSGPRLHDRAEFSMKPVTPSAVAAILGIPRSTVWRWLTGSAIPSPLALRELYARGIILWPRLPRRPLVQSTAVPPPAP
jgi:hypothetical protein